MTEQQAAERWYDAYEAAGLQGFFDALLGIFRKDHPREAFTANRRRLWQLIEEKKGSLDGRLTWLRIVSEMIDKDTVDIKQRQPDGSDKTFSLDAAETGELVRPGR